MAVLTLLTLFRSVTQRSEERRQVPWKRLMGDVLFALVTTTRRVPIASAQVWLTHHSVGLLGTF
jgi:hypothetical protein